MGDIMDKFLCGIDLGGTKINTVIITNKGEMVSSYTLPTLAHEGPEKVIQRMKETVYKVLEDAKLDVSDLEGIGVASPGPLDAKKGIVLNPPNLPGWIDITLAKILEDEFKIPVKLQNDANCAALAEYYFGAGNRTKNFVYITISTGIGGGAIIDGKLYDGANSNAAEFGHASINFDGEKCQCGSYGCFEMYASGTALANFAAKEIEKGRESVIKDIAKDGKITAKDVFEAYKMGDNLAKELIEREAFYLGVGIANIIMNYNPEVIALGGGVANGFDILYPIMIKTVEERCYKASFEGCKIVKAKLGQNSGAIGAAVLNIVFSKN